MKNKRWKINLLSLNDLKSWLHKEITNLDKLLITLAAFDGPCKIKDLKEKAVEAGLRSVAKWNVSGLLSRSKGLAINTPNGWELTGNGHKHLKKLGVKTSITSIDLEKEFNPSFEKLLHPVIVKASLKQYKNKHYREAVLNGTLALGDLIRARTGFTEDGDALMTKVFSSNNPVLIFSDITTESGKNDQRGFMMILQGITAGVRNPKAHTLKTKINHNEAAQYLIFLSLLARRISDAKKVNP